MPFVQPGAAAPAPHSSLLLPAGFVAASKYQPDEPTQQYPTPHAPAPAPVDVDNYCSEHQCEAKYGVCGKPGANQGRPYRVCPQDGCATLRFSWTDGKGRIAPAAIPHAARAHGGPVPGWDAGVVQSLQAAIEHLESREGETRQRLNDYIEYCNTHEVEMEQRHSEVAKLALATSAGLERLRATMAGKAPSPKVRQAKRPRREIAQSESDDDSGNDASQRQ